MISYLKIGFSVIKSLRNTKEYLIDKSYEETLKLLQNIADAPFYTSSYGMFGSFKNFEPPQFVFMSKLARMFGRGGIDKSLTKIFVSLYSKQNQTEIVVEAKSNWVIYTLAVVAVIYLTASILVNYTPVVLSIIIFVGVAILIFFLDRIF
ncbi:hypothetical protein A9P82_00200 [Arachidicoccus ginsenosidimutans]|uniref:hypothetical protein n=1 Tax=Arachidicoccus sp. BS20 TaxID=1850526 RepID=UPI0007F0A0F4|nr:hypothetical protein [Arachidicoccus sp. BS20]ANI87878.1 hypothetical protein A9P82_00200 [Arachidicoccus sp. BS20]